MILAATSSRCIRSLPLRSQAQNKQIGRSLPAIGPRGARIGKLVSRYIHTDEPLAVAAVDAIHIGNLPGLKRLLAENPGLAQVRLGDNKPGGMSRTLLHVATDWPAHFPNGAATVAVLIEAGAEVNARFSGPHTETPVHWAASSDDVGVLDALLNAGADIEAASVAPPRFCLPVAPTLTGCRNGRG